jgi:hypothetical protein
MQIPLISRVIIGQVLVTLLISIIFIWSYQTCPKIALTVNDGCQLSLLESDGFMCEPDALWNERKKSYHIQDKENMIPRNTSFFFLDNWTPNFHCSNARRIGTTGEGGKWVCDPNQLKSRNDCLVYSAGSNGEFGFELGMKQAMPHCEIHTFDKDFHQYPNDTCIFHTIKLGDGAPMTYSKNWTTIVHELKHKDRIIDIFKIDIEGGEYAFFPLVFDSSKSSFPRQILVELHPQNGYDVHTFFRLLRSNGYVIFSKEQNLLAGQYYFEYSFLRFNSRFFTGS